MALPSVVFEIFNDEKCRDLEIRVRGHESGTTRKIGYGFLLVFYNNFLLRYSTFKNAVTLKTGLWVRQDH